MADNNTAVPFAPGVFPDWEYQVLAGLQAPATESNLQALNYWAQSEGSVNNNPLAASGQSPGTTICVAQCGTNSPVYEYDTPAHGAAHIVNFLQVNGYSTIIQAFQKDAGLTAIFQAINQSGWCSGCQGGKYPVALYAAMNGNAPAINPGVGGGGPSLNGQVSIQTKDCKPVIGEGGVLGIGAVTLLNSCQAQEIAGVLLMLGGVAIMALGTALILGDLGSRSKAGRMILSVVGGGVAGRAAGKKAGAKAAAAVPGENRPANSKDAGNIPDSAFGSIEGTGRSGAQEAAMNREHKDRFALLPGEEPFPD